MIVVTTPSGQIGAQVLDKVLDSDEHIRVVVRDPSRLEAKARDRVEVVHGSHDDPDVVTKAFAGADTVFWVVPPNMRVQNVVDYYEDFTRPASEAIKAQGVKRVVAVSSLGRESGEIAKRTGHLSAAFAMDDLLEATGVSYRATSDVTAAATTLLLDDSWSGRGPAASCASPSKSRPNGLVRPGSKYSREGGSSRDPFLG
ncbi:NAD(P)H-binding protein [Nonomuraea turcica]|uniref:NAD(P)H-binding protein n=1 Tax=Nonomuraea sp. G32 TaxID=3067274 RepID=UPI00273CA760|nr:NAD(P)H-binding protein [Nonomuraea sp. G32]MDP4510930.1 NAD(P)H-binding protein [Nonomuraea sp. G32]